MPNINVRVVEEDGDPLPNAAVTLLGAGTPQMQPTNAAGESAFAGLADGIYRLLVAHEGFNTRAANVTLAGADVNVPVNLRTVDEEGADSRRSRLFGWLTVAQYAFLAAVGGVFVLILYKNLTGQQDLGDIETARGMITFVVSVVTVAMGLILVLAAFLSGGKDIEKRFGFGKDVFTILVGVLGTIMGFYYGQEAAKNGEGGGGQQTAQVLQISDPRPDPAEPAAGTTFGIISQISGGDAPYKYTITFDPANIIQAPPADQPSADGTINHQFTVPAGTAAGTAIKYTITASDKNNKQGTNDKGQLTIGNSRAAP
jgi:hypothetical protein